MATNNEGIGTRVSVLGDKEYKAALSDIGRQLNVLNSEMAATQSAFDSTSDAMDAARAKSESLQAIYEKQAEKVKLIAAQLEKAKQDYGDNSKQADNLRIALNKATAQMNKTGSELKDVQGNLDEMEGALDDTSTASGTLTNAADDTAEAVTNEGDAAEDAKDDNSALGDAMSAVGSVAKGAFKIALEAAAAAIAAMGAAAVAGMKELLELGDSYETAMGQLGAQTGTSGKELERLGEIATEVYRDNFGESLEEVSANMATVQTNTGLVGDELKNATEYGYMLSDTFGMDFSESSRAASSLMEKFGISAEEAYNLIAVGAQNGANQNGDLLDVISEYAPKYAEMGLTADQMMQTFINGAESGVFQIDKVGDAMKEFSIRAIDGSDTTRDAFESLGLNADYMAAQIAEGGPVAEATFRQVVNALQSVEDPMERNRIAVELFGTQYEDLGEDALSILAGITDTSATTADALGQINEVKYNSLSSALQGVQRQIEGEFMPLANELTGTVTGALQDVSDALSDGFQPEDIQVIGESIANALMSGIQTISTLINDNMGIVQDALNMAVSVVVEALPALVDAVLPAAMSLLQGVLDAITENVEPLATLAADIVTNVANFLIENASGMLEAATQLITSLVDGISAALPELLPAAASMVVELVNGLVESLPDIIASALTLVQGLADGIVAALPTLTEALPQIITTITTTIIEALPDILACGASVLTELINGITSAIPDLTASLPEVITAIITALTEALPDILEQGVAILTAVIEGIVTAIPALVEAMPQVVSAIWDALKNVDWLELGTNMIQGLVDGLSSAVGSLLESIKGVFQSIWDAILDLFGIHSPSTVAAEAGKYILDGLVAGFEEAVDAVCETVKKIFGKIWDAIKSIFGFGGESDESKEAKQAGEDIMGGIKKGITGSEDDLEKAVKEAAQAALKKFKSEFGVENGNSTVTEKYGEQLAAGLNEGLKGVEEKTFKSGANAVLDAVEAALNTAFGVESTGFLGAGGDSATKFKEIGAAVCKAIAAGISSNNNNSDAVKEAITGVADAAYQQAVKEMANGITGGTETVNAAVEQVANDAIAAANALIGADAGSALGSDWVNAIADGAEGQSSALDRTAGNIAKSAANAVKLEIGASNGKAIGQTFGNGIKDGMNGYRSTVRTAASSLGSNALSALWSAVGTSGSKFEAIGEAIAKGIARGISNNTSVVTTAAKNVATRAYTASKTTLGIRSPSRVMAEVGRYYDEGFAEGINNGMENVLASARALADMAVGETQGNVAFTSVAQQNSIDYAKLGDAVADSFEKRGLGKSVIAMDKRIVGETVEPSVSKATAQRAGKTVSGRTSRMVLAG